MQKENLSDFLFYCTIFDLTGHYGKQLIFLFLGILTGFQIFVSSDWRWGFFNNVLVLVNERCIQGIGG